MNNEQIFLTGTLGMLLMAFAIVLFIYLYQRKLIKKNLENQQIQDLLREQEMKAAYALLEGQDKERKRIAAELHDNLGSILVTLNMYADAIQNKRSEEVKSLAIKIAEISQLANDETRKISHSLDSGILTHFGLETAIRQLTEAVYDARRIQFNLVLQIGKISSDAGLEIYRIVQELINNALKHAQCTKIHLELSHVENSLSVIYEDNGIGFNKSEIVSGIGLKNIENRVNKLNGDLTIDSDPGKGSTFIIEIQQL